MSHYSNEVQLMLKKTLARAYRIQSDSKLGSATMPMNFIGLDILNSLSQNAMSIKDLTKVIDLDRTSLHRQITSLLRSGHIEKEVNAIDKRSVTLKLTQQGHQTLHLCLDQLNQPLKFAMQDLTLNEEKAILKYFSRLHQGLKQLEEGQQKGLK